MSIRWSSYEVESISALTCGDRLPEDENLQSGREKRLDGSSEAAPAARRCMAAQACCAGHGPGAEERAAKVAVRDALMGVAEAAPLDDSLRPAELCARLGSVSRSTS